jgi:serine phosphatase RsbU (regulator of sigma subunit)
MIPGMKNFTLLLLLSLIACIGIVQAQESTEVNNWLQEAIKAKQENNAPQELRARNKLAFYFWDQQELNNAITHLKRSLELNTLLNNPNGIQLTHNYLGILYTETHQYNKALSHFNSTLSIARRRNNKTEETSALLNIAQVYAARENPKKTIALTLEALPIAKEQNHLKNIRHCYGLLSESYQTLKDSEKSLYYFNQFSTIDKHIKQQEIERIQQQSKIEVAEANKKKEQTTEALHFKERQLQDAKDSLTVAEQQRREQQMFITLQETVLREKEVQLQLERLWRAVLIASIVLLLGFVIALFYFLAKIRKQKRQIEDQHEKLSQQTKQIQSSIAYAETIQQAVLPLQKDLPEYLQSFLIFHPKDVVSGDFYWDYKTPTHTYIACVDCTGHGVPGAFMSMIGTMLLNEIAASLHTINPASLLEILDTHIQKALKQDITDNTDGMDILVIAIPHEGNTKSVLFAGAKRPVYHFRKQTQKLHAIKTTRRGIGGKKLNSTPPVFENKTLIFSPGDCLYLSTDGLVDQQDTQRKRFGSQKLIKLLTSIGNKEITEQHQALELALKEHQGEEPQRDDITLLGLKFGGL